MTIRTFPAERLCTGQFHRRKTLPDNDISREFVVAFWGSFDYSPPVFPGLGRLAVTAFAVVLVFFSQTALGQISENGGVVVFEAENFDANLSPRSSHSWTAGTSVAGFTGSGYMEALPNNGTGGNADSTTAELQFTINFTSTGTHYIWIRGYAASGEDDSIFIGLDGGSPVAMTLNQYNTWQWSNAVQGGGIATINVPSTGNHVVNIWMREDGMRIDSVALSALNFWQGQSIYQVLTDRFFDGDASNNNADGNFNATANKSVHGGDFKGLEQKLDYIKSLGATAVWISPVIKNVNGEYHGYAGWDFYAVAPHWGTLADLQHMVQIAHAKGLLVINDIVVNHGGNLIDSGDSGYPNYKASGYNLRYRNNSKQFPVPFNISATNPTPGSLFHNFGAIQDYGNTTQVETGELSSLDDFRTELPYVRNNMAAIYNFWIDQAGFDGFRIDTTKHVDHGFWDSWCPQIHQHTTAIGKPNFFMFGETLDGSDAKVGSYTGTKNGGAFEQDSALNYPLYFKVNSVFATASGNTKQIEDQFNAIAGNYDPAAQMRLVNFLDNHDQKRFLNSSNANNNTARLKVALAFLYTARGIPCLYYGTEQAFNGGSDPSNREDMFAGGWEPGTSVGDNFNMTHPLFQYVAQLNNFRRLYPAMSLGTHINQWNNPNGPGLFAYARRLGNQEVFVVFNTAGSTQTLTARDTSYPAGTQLVNLLNTGEVITVASGSQTPSISVPATTAKIFIAQSFLQPLDPVVTSITPAHDAANVATSAPVIINFSKAMNTASVQAAFSTVPATTGTFAWSPGHNVLTYTPNSPGWAGSATINIHLASSAMDEVSSKPFYAAFDARFKTAPSTFSDTTPPSAAINNPPDGNTVAGALTISGNATDNVAVQRVEIQLDGGDWTAATGTASWSFNLNTANFRNGTHTINARAIDTSSNVSTLDTVEVRFFNIPGNYVQRISAGNPADAIDCNGFTWVKDQAYSLGSFGFIAGTFGYIANTISGTCAAAQPIYQRERYSAPNSTVRCLFDCPPGVYQVTLLEAETFVTGPNQRVFNVFLEGQQILSNFDIYAAAGGRNIAWSQSFNASVADARLELQFTPLVDNARISGIQVQKTGDVFTDTDGIPDWWRLAYFDHAVGEDADNSHGGDDADGDGRTNLEEYLTGTDPLDAGSVFGISSIAIAGSDVDVSWHSVGGKTYQLQRSLSPDPNGSWDDVGSPVSAGGTTSSQTDPGAAVDSLHFYRVIVP